MDAAVLHDLRRAAELADCVTMDEAKGTGLEYAERFVEAAKFLLDELEPPMPKKADTSAVRAAKALLKAKGMAVLEDTGAFDVAAMDGDVLVLVDVGVSCGAVPEEPAGALSRWSFEKRAAEYLAARGCGEMRRVRFDFVGIMELPGSKALARHTVDVFREGE